jgi:hypothetical protein
MFKQSQNEFNILQNTWGGGGGIGPTGPTGPTGSTADRNACYRCDS